MRRVFDPFQSTKDNETHLGWPLVSHEIVRQHGGELSVDSHPGVGSAFTVVLPLEQLPLLGGIRMSASSSLSTMSARSRTRSRGVCAMTAMESARPERRGSHGIMADQGFDLIISDIIMRD